MNGAQAINLLQEYAQSDLTISRMGCWLSGWDMHLHSYRPVAAKMLIDRISRSDKEPIDEIMDFYQWMDDCVAGSDGKPQARYFASAMEHIAREIIDLMK